MSKENTTYGAKPEGLERLLGLGIGTDRRAEAAPDKVTANLLHARLAGTLPLTKKMVEDLPAIIGHLREELLPLAGKPLGDLLLDQETSLKVIKSIKDYGKQMAQHERSSAEHAVSITIYFAAIASALLFHGKKITTHSYDELSDSFQILIDKRWMTTELARHLAKARRMCRKKAR